MKKRIIKYGVLAVTITITFFIFSMSSAPAGRSDEISLETTKAAVGFLAWIPFVDWTMDKMRELAYFWNPYIRKAAHFTEFAALGISSFLTVKLFMETKRSERIAQIAFAYCITIACLDEFLQRFIEGRHGSIWDVLLDGSGSIAGILLFFVFSVLWKRAKRVNRDKG